MAETRTIKDFDGTEREVPKYIDNTNNPYRKMAISAKDSVVEGAKYLKDKVLGTEEQNNKALEDMRKMDEKDPDTAQAKVNRLLGRKKGGTVSSYKSGGKVSSASKRADGCAIKGKTRGKMV
jgi:hypothetical protein